VVSQLRRFKVAAVTNVGDDDVYVQRDDMVSCKSRSVDRPVTKTLERRLTSRSLLLIALILLLLGV